MATDYRYQFDFKAATIAFNALGIHRLRNGLIIKTTSWDQVVELRMQRGMDYNNWLLMLVLGGAAMLGGISMLINAFVVAENLSLGWFLRGNFYGLTIAGFGGLLLVLGIRRTMVIEFKTADERWHRHSLREIAQQDKVRGLVFLMQKHIPKSANATFLAA